MNNGIYGFGLDIGGTDNQGHPINVTLATAITYDLCITACGTGPEPFVWSTFSQQFGAWLLPWLALVSQLPFGANDKVHNLDSMLLTLGSPMLAAYSLALTLLNKCWIAQRFEKYKYPNSKKAMQILSSLQQSPLKIETEDGLLASLIVLPENDEWWSELSLRIDFTHTWSISAATSITWVIVAYLLTLIDSFSTGGITSSINANGQGVGSLWLWLLPIVIGWLQISPNCDSTRLRSAVERVNKIAYVATDEGGIVLAKYAATQARAIELTLTKEDYLRRDEKCTAPIYNYARFFPWVEAVETVSAAFEAASDHFYNHKSVDPSIKWVNNDTNRVGNARQVKDYCESYHNWRGSEIPFKMFVASVLASILQWGTVGGAIVIVWFTPTKGLGCRSAAYLLYTVLSILVWILLITSSILTHHYNVLTHYYTRRHDGRIIPRWYTNTVKCLSIIFRCLGKAIAAFNSIWIILSCVLQFGNFFDRCYCNSSVFWLRHHAYNVISLVSSDITSIKSAWAGGVCLAIGSAIIYVLFVNVCISRS